MHPILAVQSFKTKAQNKTNHLHILVESWFYIYLRGYFCNIMRNMVKSINKKFLGGFYETHTFSYITHNSFLYNA